MRQLFTRRCTVLLVTLATLVLTTAHALTGVAQAQPAASASSGAAGQDLTEPLPDLPKVPKSSFDKPTKEQLDELEALLERSRHKDPLIRERAIREILEVRPILVTAIYHRLNRLADDADRTAMRELLRKIRSEARNVVRQKMRAEGKTGDVATPDYLTMVAEYAKPESDAWKNLITLLTMSRMLVAIGDVRAARALIQIYVRFGEFVRVDTQLQLEKLGDRSLAALIEARRHSAAKIGKWAERQLDLLGKAIPSETVQTEDPEVLADVLRAHGRIRDPDAARIVISFANSEKAQIRLAARQGVTLLGEVGNWQLRDTYENIVGKKPRRDWSWKRTARELFGEFDRMRLARVHDLFDKGRTALKKGNFEEACKAFDAVLAHNPMFDKRDMMVDAYLEYAKQLPKDKVEAALLAARRAERTNQDSKRQDVLESVRLTLEAERELGRGVAEQVLFRRALELDPSNQRAREALAMIERGETEPTQDYSRYYAAVAIAGAAVVAIVLIALWRPREEATHPAHGAETSPANHSPEAPAKLRSDHELEVTSQESPTSEPVATESNESPTSEPVATESDESLTSEPVATESDESPASEPVATESDESPASEPVATQGDEQEHDVESEPAGDSCETANHQPSSSESEAFPNDDAPPGDPETALHDSQVPASEEPETSSDSAPPGASASLEDAASVTGEPPQREEETPANDDDPSPA